MNEIITRCLEEKRTKHLAQFPTELLSEDEQEIITFILTWSRDYETPPSVKRVMDIFPIFYPFKFAPSSFEKEPPPIRAVFDQTIERRILEMTERKMQEADIIIEDSKDGSLWRMR